MMSNCKFKMNFFGILCVIILNLQISIANVFLMDAENFVTDKFALHRRNAHGDETVNFNQGQFINVYFCLRKESEVSVKDIRFSNDGGSDMFEVSIDGVRLGEVITPEKSQSGELWNQFVSSNQVGPSILTSSGYHVLTVNFTSTDFYGVEIDSIEIEVKDEFLEEELFKCSLFCLEDDLYDNGPATDNLPSIRLTRKVYPLVCEKEDNILLPMYHKNPKFYMISAMLPKYRSFENHKESHYVNCVPPSDEIWEFTNFSVPFNYDEDDNGFSLKSENASLVSFSTNQGRTIGINIKFLQPQVIASTNENRDTGHVLSIRFKKILYPFYVQMQYKGKSGEWSEETAKYFTPQSREDIWTLSEYEWSKDGNNEVEFVFLTDPNFPVQSAIEYVKITKRQLREIKRYSLYRSADILFEVVEIQGGPGVEPNSKNKMEVTRVETGETWNSVSYISVSHILPWSQKYGEVLRLYQNGNLKALPMTPPGLNRIPFGSSVIVGQSNVDDRYPSAPISHVGISPGALQLYITYKDEGKANVIIKPSLHDTKVIIKDIEITKDPMLYPFAILSSMWKNDGSSEVDHISTNGNQVRHILNGWDHLYGTVFSFMKKCISRHNTQGPDMRIQLMTKHELFKYV